MISRFQSTVLWAIAACCALSCAPLASGEEICPDKKIFEWEGMWYWTTCTCKIVQGTCVCDPKPYVGVADVNATPGCNSQCKCNQPLRLAANQAPIEPVAETATAETKSDKPVIAVAPPEQPAKVTKRSIAGQWKLEDGFKITKAGNTEGKYDCIVRAEVPEKGNDGATTEVYFRIVYFEAEENASGKKKEIRVGQECVADFVADFGEDMDWTVALCKVGDRLYLDLEKNKGPMSKKFEGTYEVTITNAKLAEIEVPECEE